MSNSIDDRALLALVEESDDLHADAMRDGREQLGDYVEAAKEARFEQSRAIGAGAIVAGAAGAAVLGSALPAFASGNQDIAILQTAASIENLAVATYGVALTLPFIGGSSANAVVKTFVMKTKAQHEDHAAGFNAAVKNLGGKEQNNPDPKYLKYVNSQKPHLTDAGKVTALAIALEDVAAQTYTKNVTLVSTSDLRQTFASVAGVEAQHKAILLAVQALIAGGAPQLIALPPNLAKLPKAAGSVGFPDTFYPIKSASPASEGAVK
ncbi:MAG: ferritin-like domain-containing protein [Frankiaceae bacterium]|nr:ferritin-like domain-containing protein [Frankiaceae bacterium]MBV9872266.1 ferritin-like domain-containing protein [Frankiaceae bacterium]